MLDLLRRTQIKPLHIDRGDLPSVAQLDDPIVILIATNRFRRVNRLRDFQLRRFPALNQFQHQRGRAQLHRRRPLTHVGVANNDVEPAILAGIGVRLIPRIHQRAAIHGVDADQNAKEIRSLRNLKYPGLTGRALRFNPHLAGASKNLSRDQKREGARDDAVPWDVAPHQVIIVATVAMTEKVGVIFIKPDPFAVRQVRIPASGAFGQNPFARFLLGHNLM